jgi:S1-C subfamily serine protease
MRLFTALSLVCVLYSCDAKPGDDIFGGGNQKRQSSDWFGGNGDTEKEELKNETPKKPKPIVKEEKTLGEKLLDVSVSICTYNRNGELIPIGSGAFIKENLIVTNVHVIDELSTIVAIRNSDKKQINVKVYKVDQMHDVAVLKTISFKSEDFLKIKSKFPRIGNDVWVAGAPMGQEGTISNGIVSAIRKHKPFDFDQIQFTAPISFGSSGGPLVNTDFELIGITVSGIDDFDAQNLNFAVPAKYINHLLDSENN